MQLLKTFLLVSYMSLNCESFGFLRIFQVLYFRESHHILIVMKQWPYMSLLTAEMQLALSIPQLTYILAFWKHTELSQILNRILPQL